MRLLPVISLIVIACATTLRAQILPPPTAWSDWSMKLTANQPGELRASDLLDKPAGRLGGIVCRDGHFYSGNTRVRFWGVNLTFAANFPTHAKADELASRFAAYGINAVRFHHMDNMPFPNGIFADDGLTSLSPEALDRLDYFISALKAQGIYADLNLHVSRSYTHYLASGPEHHGPRVDKMVDLFDPELIDAQKQYAHDLLGHLNAFTHARYADEPAVAIVEINNENSMFMWEADKTLASLAGAYRDELQRQWNRWLIEKYQTRQKLERAWNIDSENAGANVLRDGKWTPELHDTARMEVTSVPGGIQADVNAVDSTDWHLQLVQSGLRMQEKKAYTVRFDAWSDRPVKIGVAISQAHGPWQSLGLETDAQLETRKQSFSFSFTASQSDANARLGFILGQQTGKVFLSDIQCTPGGGTGLSETEDPGIGDVLIPSVHLSPSRARRDDWYTFLQQTEERYYAGMLKFLKGDCGVKCAVTGTCGFGPMGTYSQSKMDFVDGHAYWQHPIVPAQGHGIFRIGRFLILQWSISPRATLWDLAATRVAGKPFTVTEYQHPAPNDFQAECIPFIATFAALQDWDGVFLFDYGHDANDDKISGFFDIESNPAKMPLMPMGARLLSAVVPEIQTSQTVALPFSQVLAGVPRYSGSESAFLTEVAGLDPRLSLTAPLSISFDGKQKRSSPTSRATWVGAGLIRGDLFSGTLTQRSSSALPRVLCRLFFRTAVCESNRWIHHLQPSS